MTADVMKVVGEIEALYAKATPRPWTVWDSCSFRRISHKGDGDVISGCVQASDGHPDLHAKRLDLELLCALVNAWPTLKSALETLAQEKERLTRERDDARWYCVDESRVVDRIWTALGITGYAQAKPYAIHEHVERLKARAEAAEAEATALREALVELVGERFAWEREAIRFSASLLELGNELGIPPEQSMQRLGDAFLERLANVETERDYYRAIVLGTWPDADALIARKRASSQSTALSEAGGKDAKG